MSLRRFMHRRTKDEELAEEIESHLAHEQDTNAARGLSSQEARRQANIKFGNPRTLRERMWHYRGLPWIEDIWRDLRFALRALAKTPGFIAIAIIVIAVGICDAAALERGRMDRHLDSGQESHSRRSDDSTSA